MEFSIAEQLVMKHFNAEHKRRWYVWLGLGFINMAGGVAFGHYLKIPEGGKIHMQDLRFSLPEELYRKGIFKRPVARNKPDAIFGLLIDILRASHRELTGQVPDEGFGLNITAKARLVLADYLKVFPLPDED